MINIDELFDAIGEGRKGKNIGMLTGLPKLDDCLGGIQKGIYYLLFGPSGSGKSSLALYSFIYRPLKDYPEKDFTLVYYSLEMSSKVLLAKLLGLYLYEEYQVLLSYKDLMSWETTLSEENYKYAIQGKEWLKSIAHKLIIFDKELNRNSFYRTSLEILEENGYFTESEDGKRKIYVPNNQDKLIIEVIDHIGLVRPVSGASKKEEIDAVSAYAVTLREKAGVSFVILQQENRINSDMDRRKADLLEPTADGIKDSGSTHNDCNVCIGVFYPEALKLKTSRGYPIIVDPPQNNFIGLRNRYRGIYLIKNREGENNKCIPTNFFGEIGLWKELPKADTVKDWIPYTYLPSINKIKIEDKPKDEVKTNEDKEIIYSF